MYNIETTVTVLLMYNDLCRGSHPRTSLRLGPTVILLSSELYIHIIRWRVSVSDLKVEEVPLLGVVHNCQHLPISTESTNLGEGGGGAETS